MFKKANIITYFLVILSVILTIGCHPVHNTYGGRIGPASGGNVPPNIGGLGPINPVSSSTPVPQQYEFIGATLCSYGTNGSSPYTSGYSDTCTTPYGTQVGDQLIAIFGGQGSISLASPSFPTFTECTGFPANSGGNPYLDCWRHVVAAGEPYQFITGTDLSTAAADQSLNSTTTDLRIAPPPGAHVNLFGVTGGVADNTDCVISTIAQHKLVLTACSNSLTNVSAGPSITLRIPLMYIFQGTAPHGPGIMYAVRGTNGIDVTATPTSGTSASPAPPSETTTTNGDLIVNFTAFRDAATGFCSSGTKINGCPTAENQRIASPPGSDMTNLGGTGLSLSDYVQTSSGATPTTSTHQYSIDASRNWVSGSIAFKPAVSPAWTPALYPAIGTITVGGMQQTTWTANNNSWWDVSVPDAGQLYNGQTQCFLIASTFASGDTSLPTEVISPGTWVSQHTVNVGGGRFKNILSHTWATGESNYSIFISGATHNYNNFWLACMNGLAGGTLDGTADISSSSTADGTVTVGAFTAGHSNDAILQFVDAGDKGVYSLIAPSGYTTGSYQIDNDSFLGNGGSYILNAGTTAIASSIVTGERVPGHSLNASSFAVQPHS